MPDPHFVANLLKSLGIGTLNPSACTAPEAWSAPDSKRAFAATNPATEGVIAHVTGATADDYERVMQEASEAFRSWRNVPAPQRGELIARIAELISERGEDLASLVSLETGKSIGEARGEVGEMIDMARFAVGQSRMLYGFTMQSQREQHRMFDQWLPIGVVGVITAYNFPVAVWSWNAFVAAVCGNTVVWKPSPKVPLSAIALQHIANQAMRELNRPGVFSLIIPEGVSVAELLARDPRVRLVSFTGSSAVGRKISRIVGDDLGRRALLECSGNNACIVDETAELELAIPAIAFGALGTTGQRCTSMRRLIVHKSRTPQIVEGLVQAYAEVKIGDPFEHGTLIGPLIDKHAVEAFQKAVAEAIALGGELVTGGKTLTRPGYFVEATIIKAKNEWPCVQHETFAPILYVIEYETFEEALALQNGVTQGLASGLQSTNIRHIERFLCASGSDCGIAKVNMGTTGADVGAAFGGEKETGGGRASGSEAWKSYMRRQSVCINWGNETPWRHLLSETTRRDSTDLNRTVSRFARREPCSFNSSESELLTK